MALERQRLDDRTKPNGASTASFRPAGPMASPWAPFYRTLIGFNPANLSKKWDWAVTA